MNCHTSLRRQDDLPSSPSTDTTLLFFCVGVHSIQFNSILFHSILFHSILLNNIHMKLSTATTTSIFSLLTLFASCRAFRPETPLDRRNVLQNVAAASAAALLAPMPVLASGGATAGKYTTIPIAKRRYYGRVQQAVHEFLLMGPDVVKGDMTATSIQYFFDELGVVVVPAKRKDIRGVCTKKDNDCAGKEIRDSRYNDMKASMYLVRTCVGWTR